MIDNNPNRSYSSVIIPILVSRKSIVLVYDSSKPPPILWKLPGGGVDSVDNNDPEKTAIRELCEETGLEITEDDQLTHILKENMGVYDRHLFLALIGSEEPVLKKKGDEGESISTFSLSEFEMMDDFLPHHRKVLDLPYVKEAIKTCMHEFLGV